MKGDGVGFVLRHSLYFVRRSLSGLMKGKEGVCF